MPYAALRILAPAFLLLVASAAPSPAAEPEPDGSGEWPRERLVALVRDLADEAFDRFVVQDPNRRVYGMAYEFVRDGRHVQDFGLDSMHDGAWLASALVTAHRADPEGGYLDRARRFQVPFYVNLLTHSDRLFPNMIPREGQEQFDAPIKGWAPRGWDDGPGVDLVAGVPFSTGVVSHPNGTVIERDAEGRFQHAYFTSSHHLLQDLADSLLAVWLTTRDSDVARAILLMHEGRMDHGRRVPVVQTAAGLASGREDFYRRPGPPEFDPAQAFRPLWQGLVERQAVSTGHYDDGLAWSYGEECARAAISGEPIWPGFVANTIGRVYAQALVTEAYFGPDLYRPGYTLSPGAAAFEEGTGRLKSHYDDRLMLFARGVQYAWIAAAVLPSFRDDPSAWNAGVERLAAEGKLDELRRGAAALGVTLETDPEQVTAYLDRYILGTIDYWAGVRRKLGYLPRGYFPDGRPASWTRMAELGAYAHLIKLVALRLMSENGVPEWREIREQAPEAPLPHTPLPESVLKVQGLRS